MFHSLTTRVEGYRQTPNIGGNLDCQPLYLPDLTSCKSQFFKFALRPISTPQKENFVKCDWRTQIFHRKKFKVENFQLLTMENFPWKGPLNFMQICLINILSMFLFW
jgi:hypothetical protein